MATPFLASSCIETIQVKFLFICNRSLHIMYIQIFFLSCLYQVHIIFSIHGSSVYYDIIFILMNREDTLIKITIKLIIFSYSENSVFLSRKPLCHIYVISNADQRFSKFCRLE